MIHPSSKPLIRHTGSRGGVTGPESNPANSPRTTVHSHPHSYGPFDRSTCLWTVGGSAGEPGGGTHADTGRTRRPHAGKEPRTCSLWGRGGGFQPATCNGCVENQLLPCLVRMKNKKLPGADGTLLTGSVLRVQSN